MRTFRFYDDHLGLTEPGFRSHYGKDVRQGVMRCCSGILEDAWCKNKCHFLMAAGIEHVDDEGFFPVFGIDCDVDVLCWGGDDVENSTIETYCKECAAVRHKYRLEQEQKEEIEYQQRTETERRQHAQEEQKQRTLFDYWNNLSDILFERQCAQLFRDLGFKAETTSTTNDGGIDVVLPKDRRRGAAQCKAWCQPCGVKEVREFYGAVCAEKLDFGYFISKSGFTEKAGAFLKRTATIQGWSINDLIEHAMKRTL